MFDAALKERCLIAAGLIALTCGTAFAQVRSAPVNPVIPGLHNTGVDAGDKKLKAGDPDPHYKVSGPVSGQARVVSPSDLPPDWINRQDSSQWISIADDTIGPEGTYRYEMRIDLTGFDPSSVVISAMWGVDNAGAQIYLNGRATGIVNNVGPSEYTDFVLDRGFVAGINTIEFVVPNLAQGGGVQGKPEGGGDSGGSALFTGLRVQLNNVSAQPASTDLAIAKSHQGNFTAGGTGVYAIVVSNAGDTASSGTVTVSDSLPAGLTPTAATGSGWSCDISGQDVTCTRNDTLPAGQSYPAISITVNVSPTATSVTNTARVKSDDDSNASNDTASDPTTIASAADLAIQKRHDAAFQQGGTGAYQIDVKNEGASPSAGTVTVTDTLPAGLTPTAASGSGWSCSISGQTVTCTRGDPLAGGASYPTITITVNVSPTAGTVTNTATVSGGGDGNAANNSDSDHTVIGQASRDVAIAKTHTGDFVAGDTGRTFTVTVSNPGNVASTGTVTVTDALPAGLTPTAAAGTGWNCSISGATVTCSRSDALAAGQAYPAITITVNVAATASDLVNTATVQNDADTVPTNNSAKDEVQIATPAPPAAADLVVTKSHTGTAYQGQTGLVFRLVVRNRGTAATSGAVTMSDPFPVGLTPTSADGQGWSCSISARTVTCTRGDALAASQSFPAISITANVAADAATTTNVATVSGGADSVTANNTGSDNVVIGPAPRNGDLAIAKSHTGDFTAGDTGRAFTVRVTNPGEIASTGLVTVSDVLPAGLTPTAAAGSGWTCSIAGATVTCTRSDTLAAGQAYPDITITVNVATNATDLVNVATLENEADSVPTNNTAQDQVVILAPAPIVVVDLVITKSHTGGAFQGQIGLPLTLVVRNRGGAATSGKVTVSDPFPDGLTPTGASGSGWNCEINGRTVTCEREDALGPALSYPEISMTADVAANADTVTNVATVAGGADGDTSNNTGSHRIIVARALGNRDLAITKSHTGTFVAGDTGRTFTVRVSNSDQLESTGLVTVTDTLPAGLTPTAAAGSGWSCSISGPTVTCSRSDALPPGQAYPDITITVNVATDASDLVNVATVQNDADIDPTNNSAQDEVVIAPPVPSAVPDLAITKSHTGSAVQGQTGLPFRLVVRNRGGAATTGRVTVSDPFPAGLTPRTATGQGWNCSIGGGTVTCEREDPLGPALAYPEISIAADVAANATSTTNVAAVAGGGDGNPSNNTASDAVPVSQAAPVSDPPDLTITKSHAGVLQPEQPQSFLIEVRNIGTGPTTDAVTVVDTLPAGLTPANASGDGWSCAVDGQSVTCSRSDPLAPAAKYPTITIGVSVLASAQSGTNIATVTTANDAEAGNNSADDVYTVGGRPDLTITKSHTGNFQQGQTGVTYTGLIRNLGDGPTSGEVIVTDTLPEGFTARSASGDGWTCVIAPPAGSCRRSDSLAPGAAFPPITLTVDIAPDAVSAVNVATVSGGGDTTPGNNSSTDPTTITGGPQLTITKRHATPVLAGQGSLPFTITVVNNGGAPTTGAVTVTDMVPAGFTVQAAFGDGWECSTGANVSCTRADALDAGGAFPSITIDVAVSATAASAVNVATVSGGGDTTPADNTAQDPIAIAAPGLPNLTIDKSHTGVFRQGQAASVFTIVVTNVGAAPSAGTVTVTDELPVSLTPNDVAGDGWSCSIAVRTVTCSRLDALEPGRSWPAINLTVTVAADAPLSIVNAATVSGGGDTTPENNSDTDEVSIATSSPDLTITKRHDDPFSPGQSDAAYTITVANVGSAPTTGEVLVSDYMPGGVQPAEAAGSGWTCAIAGQTVTCRRSDSLAPGASYPIISIRVVVLPNATSGTNVATVSGGGDLEPDNNTANDATTIGAPPDLTITMSSVAPVIAGGETEYTAVAENIGGGSSVGPIAVVSQLSEALTPLVATGSGWVCQITGRSFRCETRATVQSGQKLPALRFRVGVSANPVSELVASGQVIALVDADPDNNDDELRTSIAPAKVEMTITQVGVPDTIAVGGAAAFVIRVINTGSVRVTNLIVDDVLPRGFHYVDGSSNTVSSVQRARGLDLTPVDVRKNALGLAWRVDALEIGEQVVLGFRALVGADARDGLHRAIAGVVADGPGATRVVAGPAPAEIHVLNPTFSLRQVLVGRVFEDVDGDGSFGEGDRAVEGARVVTSTGQAAITDPNGMYNIPSLGLGSVAISLDPGTVPASLTLAADGPGGGSWSRLLRTPIGGGALLRQDFRLVPPATLPAAGAAAGVAAAPGPAVSDQAVRAPLSEVDRVWPGTQQNQVGGATPPIPPRRDYVSRQGPAMMIALGELAVGRAAPEFDLFDKDGDAWGYGSIFYQGGLGSIKNRLTLSYDSRRHLNNTTGSDRLFEFDPNDRVYPVMGDTSRREELAQSNSKFFARFERGLSYVMYGDLLGDLPESNDSGGRLSSYSRHLTGVEGRYGGDTSYVAVRGARPTTSYARDVFSGTSFGFIALSRPHILPGTETVSLEVRDRRAPERILSRQVLARDVDYRLQPVSGTLLLLREAGSITGNLDLVQVVVTYEYEGTGAENIVAGGRGSVTRGAFTIGASAFTEEPDAGARFTVAGVNAIVRLPNAGRLELDVPYSQGTPDVSSAFNNNIGDTVPGRADGVAVSLNLDQPIGTRAAVRATFLDADRDYANPFAATTTPGARYGRVEAEFKPFAASRLIVGTTHERNETSRVDNDRNTVSALWDQQLGRGISFGAGYAARWLDDNRAGTSTDSGLLTGEIRYKQPKFEAMARREQNVGDADDPTYPTQTIFGARFKISDDTALVYSQRLSEAAIRPIGDLSGFSSIDSTDELNIGVETRVRDALRVTSRYQIEGGINGPDAFAVIGAQNRLDLGKGFAADLGVEHGKSVAGDAQDFTSGVVGLAWLKADTFKANTRYEARERNGFSSLLTAAAAGRIASGFTGLIRGQWLKDTRERALSGYDVLGGLALRPTGGDAVGVFLSYRLKDSTRPVELLDVLSLQVHQRESRLSTDAYWRPFGWLELYGKGGWQRLKVPFSRLITDTYLGQGRVQVTMSRWVDMALENRYIAQPITDSSRATVATEIGFWPIADFRIGFGYNFRDTTDPFQRDEQGRPKGAYFTLSTKLARLFDLLGSAPAPAVER